MRTSIALLPALLLAARVAAQTTTASLGRATAPVHNLAVAITDDTLTKVRDVMNQLCIYR
jgi:hypothetical protein